MDVEVVVCPPFTALSSVAPVLEGSNVKLGAQNMHPAASGAFTGEISAEMIRSHFASYVILGHSERRSLFGETDAFINEKVQAAIMNQLKPILCVGETLGERQSEQTLEVIKTQLDGGLESVDAEATASLVIAYEPVWAIGTGKVATPDQAQAVHAFIRTWLEARFNAVGGPEDPHPLRWIDEAEQCARTAWPGRYRRWFDRGRRSRCQFIRRPGQGRGRPGLISPADTANPHRDAHSVFPVGRISGALPPFMSPVVSLSNSPVVSLSAPVLPQGVKPSPSHWHARRNGMTPCRPQTRLRGFSDPRLRTTSSLSYSVLHPLDQAGQEAGIAGESAHGLYRLPGFGMGGGSGLLDPEERHIGGFFRGLIAAGFLAQVFCGAGGVEDVVDDLEGESKVPAEGLGRLLAVLRSPRP